MLLAVKLQNLSQNTLLIFSFHDLIHKTVCQLELGSLEALRELLADRLLDDTRTRKSNQRSRLCQDDIAQGRKACRYAAGGRIRHKAYVEKSRLGMTF